MKRRGFGLLLLVAALLHSAALSLRFSLLPPPALRNACVRRRSMPRPAPPLHENFAVVARGIFETALFGVDPSRDDKLEEAPSERKSKLSLSFCSTNRGGVNPRCSVAMRETVDDDNKIAFSDPATGQVLLQREGSRSTVPRVLILVKQNDAALLNFLVEILPSLREKVEVFVEKDVKMILKHDHHVNVPSFYADVSSSSFGTQSEIPSFSSTYVDTPYDGQPTAISPPPKQRLLPLPTWCAPLVATALSCTRQRSFRSPALLFCALPAAAWASLRPSQKTTALKVYCGA